MERITIEIGGMSCGHCVGAVTRALREIEGVEVESVEVGSATVRFDSNVVAAADLTRAVEEEGFEARVAGGRG